MSNSTNNKNGVNSRRNSRNQPKATSTRHSTNSSIKTVAIDDFIGANSQAGNDGESVVFSQSNASQVTAIPSGDIVSLGDLDLSTNDSLSIFSESQMTANQISCSYCYLKDTKSLVQCAKTKRWFCNGSFNNNISHIIMHLMKSKQKEISLHANSPCGDVVIECYACRSKNIFVLGYISTISQDKVIILCRVPCASTHVFKDNNWDTTNWNPLIKDRKLLSWISASPSPEEMKNARQVTLEQINALEEEWRAAKDPNRVEAHKKKQKQNLSEVELMPITLSYESTKTYRSVMLPLIDVEAAYEKNLKESLMIENLTIRWEGDGVNKQSSDANATPSRLLVFFSTGEGNDEFKVLVGDELRLKLNMDLGKVWECSGIVVKSPNMLSSEIGLELNDSKQSFPTHITKGFIVELVWKSAPFDRMKNACYMFGINNQKRSYVSHYLQEKILGHDIEESFGYKKCPFPTNYKVKGLPELNSSQVHAINHVLRNALTLIQGPPGTGKTFTSAALIYHLLAQGASKKVLVCAPSNIAVDHLAHKIHQTGLKVVRIMARSREYVDSRVDFLSLNNQMQRFLDGVDSKNFDDFDNQNEIVREYIELTKASSDSKYGIAKKEELRRLKLKTAIEKQFLKEADVICCTCSSATPGKLCDLGYDTVLIDESTQAKDVESLIPIVNGCEKLILVGDHCQLGPIVMSKQAENCGFAQSLFERLLILRNRPIRLQVQYRMHPILSQFPSNLFYEGSLQNGVNSSQRTITKVMHMFPFLDKPMFFYCSLGFEEIAGTGTSYLNRPEAAQVLNIVTRFIRAGIKPTQIGIITPYEGQRSYIFQHMKHSGELSAHIYAEVEVANVDSFQGREKDFIILSCVRSNANNILGFLSDPRRLNVAITRAKYGLIIVGNPKVLSTNQLWHQLITFFKKLKLLVEGPLNALKESHVPIPKPRKITIPNSQANISSNSLISNYLTQTSMMKSGQDSGQNIHMTAFTPQMPIPYSLMMSLPANVVKFNVQRANDAKNQANMPINYNAVSQFGSVMDANDMIHGLINPNMISSLGISAPPMVGNEMFSFDEMSQLDDLSQIGDFDGQSVAVVAESDGATSVKEKINK